MQYRTACYRQQGEGTPSLLLSQFQCREVPVCLAYLAHSEYHEKTCLNADPADELNFWCRHFPWPRAAKRPERWLARAEKELAERVEGCGEKASRYTLLLAVGEHLLLMGGGQQVYLINTAYGQGHAERLQSDFRGILEAGAGILLATPDFTENLRLDRLGKALCPGELKEEAQMERRLRELAEQAIQETEQTIQEAEQGGNDGTACRPGADRKPAKQAAILLLAGEYR